MTNKTKKQMNKAEMKKAKGGLNHVPAGMVKRSQVAAARFSYDLPDLDVF